MDDRQLRSHLIRLAHQHPETRNRILPILKQAGDLTPDQATDELGDIKVLVDRVVDKTQRLYNRLPDNGAGVQEVWKVLEALKTAQSLAGEVIETIDLGNYQGRF
jgi:hypothetical protein